MLSHCKKSYEKPRQCIKKKRYHFTDKGPSSQSYGFSSSHVWMWDLDHKENWEPKNWCFWTVELEKTLVSPLDYSTPGFPVLTLKIVMIMLTPRSGSWCKFHHIFLPPRVCSNSCPLSQWCYLTMSSSVTLFSSCPQSFPASGSFPNSWLFPSGGQSIRASASASDLPMTIQDLFPLGLIGLKSLQSKRLSRVFSNTTVQKHQFFDTQLSL